MDINEKRESFGVPTNLQRVSLKDNQNKLGFLTDNLDIKPGNYRIQKIAISEKLVNSLHYKNKKSV